MEAWLQVLLWLLWWATPITIGLVVMALRYK